MEIIKYNGAYNVDDAMKQDEPLLALISFDGAKAYVSHVDDAVEHHILLNKVGASSTEIDQYFRIIFNKESADWTFVCPPDYKGIRDKVRRITAFYKDGITAISDFLSQIGYFVDIKIPKRYRRHFDMMGDK